MNRLLLLFVSFFSASLFADQTVSNALTPVSIQLYWRHQFEFAGYYAAIKQGYYQKAGLDLQLKDWQPNMNINDEVLSGRVNFGIGYSQIAVDATKGFPLSLVMTSFQYSPVVLVSHKPIIQLSDLSNNIVMRQDILQVLSLLKLARTDGATNIKEVPSSWDLSDFISGKVDVFSAYSTNEPFVLNEKNIEYYQLDPKSYGIVSYDDILFTSQQFAAEKPQIVQAVKDATIEGWRYALSHQEEIVDWILAHYPDYKSKEALLYEAKETSRYVQLGSIPIGNLDAVKLQAIITMAKDLGLLSLAEEKSVNIDKLIFKNNKLWLSDSERAYLQAHPIIELANDIDWAPFEFINAQGKYDGMAAEYFRYFEQLLGVQFVANKDRLWSVVQNLAFSGKSPILPCAVDTQARRQYLNFTAHYLSFPMVLIAREGERYLEGYAELKQNQTIAVVKGYWSEDYLKQHYPQLPLLVVDSVKEGLDAVIIGKAFALSDNLAAIHNVMKNYGLTGLQVIAQADQSFELAIGVHKSQPELLSILQKALAQISLEEKDAIYRHWLQTSQQVNVGIMTQLRPYFFYIGLSVALVLFLFLLLLWSRQRQSFQLKLIQSQASFAEQQIAKEQHHRKEQAAFFAMIAHEIKTPVAIIDLAVKNLRILDKKMPVSEDHRKRQMRIGQAVQALNQLIDAFLLKGQLEQNNFSLSKQVLSMQVLAQKWQKDFMGAQSFIVSCPNEIVLTADVRLVQIAVSNLINNASKYSSADSHITLTIQQQNENQQVWCVVCVVDMGVGIASDKAQLLFEAYTRGNNVGNVSGVGLGLSVVNKIVLLHGGRLTYSANPAGQGSVFCLYFPIE